MDVDSLFMVNSSLEAKHEACCYIYNGQSLLMVQYYKSPE